MSTKVPVSVVVITKNEASRLRDCLESVRWAAEIVVVDDESTDATVAIAKEYTDKVYTRRMDIEGKHRNYAYGLSSYDWVFSLDADERVTPELRDEIAAVLAKGPDCNGYAVPRRNFIGAYWARHGGMYPSAQLRLFRKDKFRYDELAEVHPQAYMPDPRGNLKSDVLHYTYRNFTDAIAKMDRQSTLEAQKWYREKRKVGGLSVARKSVDRFCRAYFKKSGSKDGVVGLFLAVCSGMYQFLSYAKYWEMRRAALGAASGDPPPADPSFVPRPAPPKGARQTVAAVVMTKNAAAMVEGTLQSVSGWADEIVVIDGYSGDRTEEICRRYTDKFYQNRWDGYRFCTERNLGNAKASSDWCFHIDPDERATPEIKAAISKMLEKGTPHAAMEFRKKNFFLGRWMRHGGWHHYSLHLFRREKARYEGVIHEKLHVDGSVGRIEAAVEHYPFSSISQFVQRHNGYSSREAQALKEECGVIAEREVDFNLRKKPLKRFFKFFLRKKAFLDGTHGFIFSVLFAWVHFINWAKYWELLEEERRASSVPEPARARAAR